MTHWVKFSRANDHLEAIDDVVRRFLDMKPYRLIRDYDPKPPFKCDGTYVGCRVYLHAPLLPPAELAVMVGDCLYSLRASLDHLIYSIALKHTGRDEIADQKFLSFPIYDTPGQFANPWLGRIKNPSKNADFLPDEVIDDLKLCQPYKGWNGPQTGPQFERHLAKSPLWLLNALCNADKHRTLSPVTQIRINELRFRTTIPGEGSQAGFTLTGSYQHGDQVGPGFSFQPDTPNAEISLDTESEPDVAFGDQWPARSRPVSKLLHIIQDSIRDDVFARFEQYL